MKRQKKLISLIAILAVVVAAYFAVSHFTDDGTDSSGDGQADYIQVFNTSRDSILEMSWEFYDNRYTLVRDDASSDWYSPDIPEAQIDQTYASAMLSAIYSVTATSSIEPADELSEYELDPEFMLITVTLDTGEQYTLHIGMYSSFAEGYYALDNGAEDTIYIIPSSVFNAFSYTIDDITVAEEDAENTQDSDSAESADEAENSENADSADSAEGTEAEADSDSSAS